MGQNRYGRWVAVMSEDDQAHAERFSKKGVAKKQLTVYTNGTPQVTAAQHSGKRATGIQGTGEHLMTIRTTAGFLIRPNSRT
jgi:hypothetical protein